VNTQRSAKLMIDRRKRKQFFEAGDFVAVRAANAGVAADPAKARSWYERAKEMASPVGRRRLEMVPQGLGSVSLAVTNLRAKGFRVGSDPLPTNAFHGQVWVVKQTARKAVHKLVKGWIVPLAGVPLR